MNRSTLIPRRPVLAFAIVMASQVMGQAPQQGPGKAPQAYEATVRVVWITGKAPQVMGGTSPLVIRVGPNASGLAPLAIAEDFAGGTGDTWRASAWIAAFCAAHHTDSLIAEHEFTVRAGGRVDGPSAGMLMATTMTALINGQLLDPEATMTGTINPDGTCGPVGGIVQKMEGAKRSGIKRFGFPLGSRLCADENNPKGPKLDLLQHAQNLGMEAREIGSIFDAYEFLTKKPLERTLPADVKQLELPLKTFTRLRDVGAATRQTALAQLTELRSAFLAVGLDAESFEKSVAATLDLIKRSQQAEDNGSVNAALRDAEVAVAQSRLNGSMFAITMSLQADDIGKTLKICEQERTQTEAALDEARTQLYQAMESSLIGAKIDALNSFSYYWDARAFGEAGRREESLATAQAAIIDKAKAAARSNPGKEASAKVQEETKVFKAIVKETLSRYAYGFARAKRAARAAGLADDSPARVEVAPEMFAQLGRSYSAAAAAGHAWYSAMFIKEQANDRGRSVASQSTAAMFTDAEFANVHLAATFAMNVDASGEGRQQATVDQLASGLYAYHGAASLVNKRYNFAGSGDASDAALAHALDLARQRVLEEAARTEATAGFIPTSVKMNFDLAKVQREGDSNDKFNALVTYWKCIFLCDLTRHLAAGK